LGILGDGVRELGGKEGLEVTHMGTLAAFELTVQMIRPRLDEVDGEGVG
jgi:hypothetical protein